MSDKNIITLIALICGAIVSLYLKRQNKLGKFEYKTPSKGMTIFSIVFTLIGAVILIIAVMRSK